MMKLSETPGKPETPSPMLGQHTQEIMEELGYRQAEIDDLLARNIIGQYGVNIESPWGSA